MVPALFFARWNVDFKISPPWDYFEGYLAGPLSYATIVTHVVLLPCLHTWWGHVKQNTSVTAVLRSNHSSSYPGIQDFFMKIKSDLLRTEHWPSPHYAVFDWALIITNWCEATRWGPRIPNNDFSDAAKRRIDKDINCINFPELASHILNILSPPWTVSKNCVFRLFIAETGCFCW